MSILCTCTGHAVWIGSKWPAKPGRFTSGRRGPSGGYCGACNRRIPADAESDRLYRLLMTTGENAPDFETATAEFVAAETERLSARDAFG